jgi:methionyl-tRNA formyltransferase
MDAFTGITWHQVHATVDTGDVITQKKIAIASNVTALELTLGTLDLAGSAFGEILPSLLDDSYPRTSVEKNGGESYHRSSDVPNGGWFDPGWNIKQAYAFLRAMDYGKFQVFAAPKVRLLGSEFSVMGYQIQSNDSTKTGETAVLFQNHKLLLSDQETKLLINCK